MARSSSLLLCTLALSTLACQGLVPFPADEAPAPVELPQVDKRPPPEPAKRPSLPPLKPVGEVASSKVEDSDRIGVTLNLHVLLQYHGTTKGQTDRSKLCGQRVIATVLDRAEKGFPAVVAEGLNRRGSYAVPEVVPPTAGKQAAAMLTTFPELKVYGFETPDVQPRGLARIDDMKDARKRLSDLSKNKDKYSNAEKLKMLDDIRTDMMPANTELVTANTPLRSYQAIQSAMAVADARGENHVSVLIGRAHWPDFEHAVESADRLGKDTFVGVRMIKYTCAK